MEGQKEQYKLIFENEAQLAKEDINLARNKPNISVDRGYAWIVLIASTIISIIYPNIGAIFGILFAHKVTDYALSSSTLAWLFNIMGSVWNLTTFFSGPLCEELGWRKTGVFGGLTAFLAILLTCFANSVSYIIVTFSCIGGFGCGLIYSVALYGVSQYFVKRRGVAMAIFGTGVGIGQFLIPQIVRYLQKTYDFKIASIIFSVITIIGPASAMLMRPVSSHSSSTELENLKVDNIKIKEKIELCNNNNSKVKLKDCNRNHFSIFINNVFKQTYRNLCQLKYPVIIIIATGMSLYITAFYNFLFMTPFVFGDRGYSLQKTAYCFSISGISNIVGRMVITSLTDLPFVNSTFCYLLGQLFVAIASLAFSFLTDYFLVCLCFGLFGIGMGITMGIQPLILIKYRDVDSLPQTFGACGLLCTACFITLGPLIGYIRDVTQSYDFMYRIFSGLVFFAIALWTLMPMAVAREKKLSSPTV